MAEGGYKIVRLLSEHIPGAIDVLRQSFFPDEKVCNCVRLLQDSEEVHTDSKYKVTKASLEVEKLALACIEDGVSFCAVDTKTGEVLGVALNKIQVKPNPGEMSFFEEFTRDHVREASTHAFMNFMVAVDSRYDLFGDDGDCYLELAYLSVKSTAKGQGIGTALVTRTVQFGRDLRAVNGADGPASNLDLNADAPEYAGSKALKRAPKCVSAIFTSRFSQRCGRRSQVPEVLQIPYTEFEYKGRKFSETTGPEHPYCTLSVKMLV